jgi:hypothetical protein
MSNNGRPRVFSKAEGLVLPVPLVLSKAEGSTAEGFTPNECEGSAAEGFLTHVQPRGPCHGDRRHTVFIRARLLRAQRRSRAFCGKPCRNVVVQRRASAPEAVFHFLLFGFQFSLQACLPCLPQASFCPWGLLSHSPKVIS